MKTLTTAYRNGTQRYTNGTEQNHLKFQNARKTTAKNNETKEAHFNKHFKITINVLFYKTFKEKKNKM